ncbi:estradiol 17-beta-dehydrogenase 11 [Leptinotarsa decemlineata]|uniref:estradiol 17-beta-dehydrogenase 11 n=1 Tax=Leptinotarsa decemlineata TaxID=7539 RepID=UPI000C255B86|nr:estradiol 17-beta-dehydrogenase 11-like [Leptinotarsa decemlineata]XP_023029300.1 estradiol 17-beta-dehydrogenase 11-like [Leptinotarsa decemlineata]
MISEFQWNNRFEYMKMVATSKESHVMKPILEVITFLLQAVVIIVKTIYTACLPSTYRNFKNISGEIALVTGGGGGLGRLLALRLAKLGATVVLWDINANGVEETIGLVKGIGGKAYGYKCDIADNDEVYRVAKKTQEEVGEVTILINNAGVVSGELLLNTPDHLIKRTFDVNIIAHFWTVKAFLPKMIEKDHGHIITVASMAGLIGVPKLVDYCASKYAAVGFDESLKIELETLGIKGVKTSVVCPYFIQQTGMFDNIDSKIFPCLKSNDVADRIILALRREENFVTIPGSFRYFGSLKPLMPWEVMSLFIKTTVPDASPHHQATPIVQIKASEEDIHHTKDEDNSLSSSVSQMTHRSIATGKDL